MNVYVLNIKNNISGIFENLDLSLDYVYSLLNARLINKEDKIYVQKYKINTCIVLEEFEIDLAFVINKKSKINYSNSKEKTVFEEVYEDSSSTVTSSVEESSDEESSVESKQDIRSSEEERIKKNNKEYIVKHNNLGQQKKAVTHDMNLLKFKQQQYENEENIYNSDIILYHKFKLLKSTEPKFSIPFMFEEKYKVFEELDSKNKLSFEHFKNNYRAERVKTQYDHMFDLKSDESNDDNETEEFVNADTNDLFIATNQKPPDRLIELLSAEITVSNTVTDSSTS
jgi:hypothetical protein